MTKDVFSNHIGGASELTVLAAIKPGFVPGRSLISYSARMRLHLRMLSQLRRMGLEGRRAGVYVGPLDALRTLQYIRWTLIDDDTRMLLAVNFDRPLEPYLRRIVDIGGPLLDSILCHCKGFEGHASDQGFHKFMEFATRHQAPVELFAATTPDMTVDDSDYFIEGDRLVRSKNNTVPGPNGTSQPHPNGTGSTDDILAELTLSSPSERQRQSQRDHPLSLLDQGMNIIQALYDNSHYFAENTNPNDPDVRDDLVYYRLLETLTPAFWSNVYLAYGQTMQVQVQDWRNLTSDEQVELHAGIKRNIQQSSHANVPEAMKRAMALFKRHEEALDWYAARPNPRNINQLAPAPFDPGNIQRDLLEAAPLLAQSNENHVVACMMLFRVDNPVAGRTFLKAMEAELWPDDPDKPLCNLSVTFPGLTALDIDRQSRDTFPVAFREGMAQRAGMLGDIDVNNPQEWVWPTSNLVSSAGSVLPGPGKAVLPESIDIIVQLAKPHNSEVSDFSTSHPLYSDVERIVALAGDGVGLIAVEPMLRNIARPDPDDPSRKVAVGHLGFQDGISQPRFRAADSPAPGDYKVRNAERFDPRKNNGRGEAEEQSDTTLMGDLLLGHPAKADLDLTILRDSREKADRIKPYRTYDGSPLRNGTFQVIRKLRIYSERFEGSADEETDPTVPTLLERMIGRRKNGAPLTRTPVNKTNNDFNYDKDSLGKDTALQSHIRRANPREADTPRILRRGYSYGPSNDLSADRGLMFIAYNADISEQFEVIQRWITGGNSTRLASYHGDPLLAPRRSDSTRTFRSFDSKGELHLVPDMPKSPPVELQWGMYAFTPSREGLRMLAASDRGPDALAPEPATPRIRKLAQNQSIEAWQRALEDVDDERRAATLDLWKQVRSPENGGVYDTGDYGVLVGSAKGVRDVLENAGNSLSTREYWNRMRHSSGQFFLGYDDPPVPTQSTDPEDRALDTDYRSNVTQNDYRTESAPANAFVADRQQEDYYADAFRTAQALLKALPDDLRYVPDNNQPTGDVALPSGKHILAERYFNDLVARLCVIWMGLPDDGGVAIGGPDGSKPHCPIDLIRASFYVFWPHPSESIEAKSRVQTAQLRDAVRKFLQSNPVVQPNSLLEKLLKESPNADRKRLDRIADTVVSVCSGFAGPTGGSFRGVMFDWITTGLFWRLQQRIQMLGARPNYKEVSSILQPAILHSMTKRAAPDLLHREVVKNKTRIDGTQVDAGKRVVISLRSALEDVKLGQPAASEADQRYFLFGGDYHRSGKPTHACPGQRMALGTMVAAFAVLMSSGDVRPESPLSFRVHQ